MLKKSFYNIEIQENRNGKVLVFNTFTKAFGILSDKMKHLYFSSDLINEEKVHDKELQESIEIMKNNGFLVDKETDEKLLRKTLNNIRRFSTTGLGLTIAPTLDCNMNCPYCYEEKRKDVMNSKTQQELVKFIKYYIKLYNIKYLSVTWYGGEPLLEKELILKLSEEFCKICQDNKVKYDAAIVTNGVLLDYETAKILKEKCKVSSVQITIDGLKDTHNKRRILKDGLDSFGIITDNIDNCKNILKIKIRSNIDKNNIDEAKKLIDYFIKERQWGKDVGFYFAPVTNSTEACIYKRSVCFTNTEYGKIHGELLEYIYSIENSIDKKILSIPTVSYDMCGAITPTAYVIDPMGYLYKCWDIIGIEKHRVGHVSQGPLLNPENLKWLSYEIDEKCYNCKMVNLCEGGCPHEVIYNNKKECNYRTLSYKNSLNIIYENYIEQKGS